MYVDNWLLVPSFPFSFLPQIIQYHLLPGSSPTLWLFGVCPFSAFLFLPPVFYMHWSHYKYHLILRSVFLLICIFLGSFIEALSYILYCLHSSLPNLHLFPVITSSWKLKSKSLLDGSSWMCLQHLRAHMAIFPISKNDSTICKIISIPWSQPMHNQRTTNCICCPELIQN